MNQYEERRRRTERKRRKKEMESADIGLHNVHGVLWSGPSRFPVVFGCWLAIACLGSAGGTTGFIFAAIDTSPVFYLGAVLFAACFALSSFWIVGLWRTCDGSGLDAAVIRVSGPSKLAGETLTMHVVQSKRTAVRIKSIVIELFIVKVSQAPNTRRGWRLKSNSIEYVDSLGKLHAGKEPQPVVPFHTQSVDDSFGVNPVGFTLQLEIPLLAGREDDRKWGLRITTTTDGEKPDCRATYFLPDPLPKWIVTGPNRQICSGCRNEYVKAKKQSQTYWETSHNDDNTETSTDHYQVYRCPHCHAIVKRIYLETTRP